MTGGGTHLRHLFRSSLPPVIFVQNMFEEYKLLAPLTTMRVGGPARFFLRVKSLDDLKKGILFAKEKNLPFFILGGGSNILVGDKGFHGVVLKMDTTGVSFEDAPLGKVFVTVSAGENWDNFVEKTVTKGLHGVENLSFIPGTVGAAPIQNIGAYGMEAGNAVAWVEVLDTKKMQILRLTREECGFAYRDSIFKRDEGKPLVVLRVAFLLESDGSPVVSYKDVDVHMKEYSIKNPTLKNVREALYSIRKKKFPDIRKMGTAGSFFKNPILSKTEAERLVGLFPDLPCFPTNDGGVKISLAWLLDHGLSWKGVRDDTVGVFENHSLVIVHFGEGTAENIKMFTSNIQKDVKEKTGISIEPEVSFVGEF